MHPGVQAARLDALDGVGGLGQRGGVGDAQGVDSRGGCGALDPCPQSARVVGAARRGDPGGMGRRDRHRVAT
ncbi:MAG TPA: hypothetical protein DEP69_03270 [Acidimicrobiaceae bacterium]|nr:hypothetical protein [Acidimicrobiaceae bacterium]